MIAYLLHASILLATVTLLYWLLLRQETFFTLNRWTILCSIVLSLGLPFITVPATLSISPNYNFIHLVANKIEAKQIERTSHSYSVTDLERPNTTPELRSNEKALPLNIESNTLTLSKIFRWIYFIGAMIFFLVFIFQLTIILTKIYSLNAINTGNYRIVELVKDEAPFSFWNTIFINPSMYDPSTYEQIIEHEKLHIDQVHFVDKILAEFLVIVFWFNPFVWLLRNSISNNLEYLTDEKLLNRGVEKETYQLSLLRVSVKKKPYNLTTNYNNSFLKNRILMMDTKKSSAASAWKYLFIPPIFFLSIICLNSVQAEHLSTLNGERDQQPILPNTNSENRIDEIKLNPTNLVVSKKRSTKKLHLDPIIKIHNTTFGNLILTSGSRQEIRIEGPDDIINHINTDVIDGEWKISLRNYDSKSNKGGQKLTIYATLQNLQSVVLSGSGNIESTNIFSSNHMDIEVSGSGNIQLRISTSQAECQISGSGNVSLAGNTGELLAQISGSGNLEALRLKTNTLQVKSSGSGNIKAHVTDRISVNSHSGSGDILYQGNPKINTRKKSGSGKIRAI